MSRIKHLVVLMLENRSFDHMFGFLDPDSDEINGLTGAESNPDDNGELVLVRPGATYTGPADPGHHFTDVNEQIFERAGPQPGDPATMNGFVRNYAKQPGVRAGRAKDVMRCFRPEEIPVLATLAREFAVCDAWFSSVPGPTLPNRAFAHCGSSNGSVDMNPLAYMRLPTIYERLFEHDVLSKIYAYDGNTLAISFPNLLMEGNRWLGSFEDFKKDVKKKKLPSYCFLEPRYNDYFDDARQRAYFASDQHPPHDVRRGEQLVAEVYEVLRKSDLWEKTLFIITYDEHGGFYDHVVPPEAVAPVKHEEERPDAITGFDFKRLGIRVPTVLVSPLIEPGTIVHDEFDHTSLIATARKLFAPDAEPLNERDRVANTFDTVVTRTRARDARKTLRGRVELPPPPARVGHRPLSEHQNSQVATAHHLDLLLPVEHRVIGTSREFLTLQDIWTEQRAIEYIRLVVERAREYWGQE